MPAQTPQGYTYATPSDPLVNWPTTSQTVAVEVGAFDERINNGGARVQAGTATINLSSASNGTVDIVLTGFAARPAITVTPRGASTVFAYVFASSATAATLGVRHHNDTAFTASIPVDWVAVGVAS